MIEFLDYLGDRFSHLFSLVLLSVFFFHLLIVLGITKDCHSLTLLSGYDPASRIHNFTLHLHLLQPLSATMRSVNASNDIQSLIFYLAKCNSFYRPLSPEVLSVDTYLCT